MSETLKFGNGQWATKVGSTLAYNDENGNFKPLPFNFTRATSATRVNKDGLIEVVTNNKPRVDFKDDANGALLLEPQRTNGFQHSEDFSTGSWTKGNLTVTSNQAISPDGTLSADKITPDSVTNLIRLFQSETVTATDYSLSFYVKYNGRRFIQLLWGGALNSTNYANFDLINGTVTNGSVGKIESLQNDWYRISISSALAAGSDQIYLWVIDSANAARGATSTGNGVDGYYLWGAQIEQGSYPTSYIPNLSTGSTTRVDETCSQTPPSGIIGQTEGTLFFESKINAQDTFTGFSLSDNTTNNEVIIRFTTQDRIEYYLRSGGTQPIGGGTTAFNTDEYVKVAFAYKSGDSAFYVNGVQVTISSTTTMPLNLISLKMSRGNNTGVFSGKAKDLRVYNTRLSNAELQQLTSL